MDESNTQFEKRKKDHLQWSLSPQAQSESLRDFNQIQLIPEALPDQNLEQVSTRTSFLNHPLSMPIFISSMTAGHKDSLELNRDLALLSQRKQILMGVGSQRRELKDSQASREWQEIRKEAPKAVLVGNLGLSQAIETPMSEIRRLVDNLEAQALFIHLNALQECLQMEGTPQFKGGWETLEKICKEVGVPVIVKEVGCGMSGPTALRLSELGVAAVDVSGAGGTHWGRVETLRYSQNDLARQIGESFSDWGLSTVESLLQGKEARLRCQLWASGGVRNGVEAMKLLSLGADMVGVARPWMMSLGSASPTGEFKKLPTEKAAMQLDFLAARFQKELQIALFCTGCSDLKDLKQKKVWKWKSPSLRSLKDFQN